MIISLLSKSYEDLKKEITKNDRIVVWTCNNCIRFCGIGGRDKAKELADLLKKDGYNVIHIETIGTSCVIDLVEERKRHRATAGIFANATAIIPLACEDGYEAVKYVFNDKKVVKVTKTLGLGVLTTDGAVLTAPFEDTGLKETDKGYRLRDAASKLGLYTDFSR
ncbi:MAG: hypothetical protein DRN20_01795 [Thermoplasmata archaeon]|nr:MAG: hypothetical protein DRN20_01795 [Thermoplasmata archaeon]